MQRRTGLRLKVNLVLVPTVAFGIAAIVWADYRHEYATLMHAHAGRVTRVGARPSAAAPIDPSTLPGAAARRSLRLHATGAAALLVVIVTTVNITLQALVLRPVAAMHARVARLERGHWRLPDPGVPSGTDDEVGALDERFRRLGIEIDALVGQSLRADRLAAMALVSKRIEARVGPEVQRIGEVAGRLTGAEASDARVDGEVLGRAAAAILGAVHEYDGIFPRRRLEE